MSSPIEQIKERINIADLISSYVKLEKAGANLKACCPFHQEKTPSFFVSPSKQMWHCFGCNSGGDHFEFIQKLEGVEFPEALKILAERAGVELKREDPRIRSERVRLLTLMEDAASFYESMLFERKDVGEYLKERGLTGETAKRFRLGYAERGWDNLFNHLKSKGYNEDEMEKSGLVIKSDKELQVTSYKLQASYYDRFRARIMFPLFDSSGRIVGFSGRIFEKDAEGQKDVDSKYINTPQTVLYDKSKILYGFHAAKDDIRKEGKAILVEGQMDLLLSHQAGAKNAIAVSGTALTPFHLGIIKRFASSLLVSFDRDRAGFNAADRSISLALAEGFDVSVISLPEGKDPADVAKESPVEWRERVSRPIPVISFLMDSLSEQTKDARELLRGVKDRVLPYVASIASEMEKAHWIKIIADKLSITEDAVWKEMQTQKAISSSPEERSMARTIPKSRKDIIEERLLGILAWKGTEAHTYFSSLDPFWFSSDREAMARSLLAAGDKGNDSHYIKKLALESELAYASGDILSAEAAMLVGELKKEYVRERLEALASDMKRAEGEGNIKILGEKMDEFKKLSRELHAKLE